MKMHLPEYESKRLSSDFDFLHFDKTQVNEHSLWWPQGPGAGVVFLISLTNEMIVMTPESPDLTPQPGITTRVRIIRDNYGQFCQTLMASPGSYPFSRQALVVITIKRCY